MLVCLHCGGNSQAVSRRKPASQHTGISEFLFKLISSQHNREHDHVSDPALSVLLCVCVEQMS